MLIGIGVAAVGAAAALIVWLSLRSSRRIGASRHPKVVPLRMVRRRTGKPTSARKSKRISKRISPRTSTRDERPAEQQTGLCSLCRERSARLYFYVDESGRAIGACKACRPKAEARQLDRL